MLRKERYTGAYPPVVLERIEVERQSPVSVQFRRYDWLGNLVENRPATTTETNEVNQHDKQETQIQGLKDFVAKTNALPAGNPIKAILLDLIKSQAWE